MKRGEGKLLVMALGFLAGYILAKEGISLGEIVKVASQFDLKDTVISHEVEQETSVKQA